MIVIYRKGRKELHKVHKIIKNLYKLILAMRINVTLMTRIFNIKHRLHKFAQIEIERQSVCILSIVSVALKKMEHG